MALSELQRPDKTMFYNNMQRIADEMSRHMASWEMAADFINASGVIFYHRKCSCNCAN